MERTVTRRSLSLLALVLLLVIFVGARSPTGDAITPPSAPARTSAPISPSIDASSAPVMIDATAAPAQVSVPLPPQPATQTATPASPPPVPQTATPASPPPVPKTAFTAAPRASVSPGPATTAVPTSDIHAIAPEPGLPGYSPPPGRQ